MGKTTAEKIFESHLVDRQGEQISILSLDRVFCHEITTPIAINDLVKNRRTGQNHAHLGKKTRNKGLF